MEEIPLLKDEFEAKAVEDRKLWDEMEEERITQLKAERQMALKTRDRLNRMTKDKDEFINTLKQSRLNIYKVSFCQELGSPQTPGVSILLEILNVFFSQLFSVTLIFLW